MRNHRTFGIIMLAGAGVALVACARQVQVETGEVDLATRWTAVLMPPGDTAMTLRQDTAARDGAPSQAQLSGLRIGGTGSMMAADDPNHTRAVVSIFGATPGATHPWHVHAGRCGDDRGILGQPSDYAPIAIGADGRGDAVATVSSALPVLGDYFVNVHASPTEMWKIVSCGNLARR